MRFIIRTIIAICILGPVCLTTSAAAQQSPATRTITGHVVNGTAGYESVDDIAVILHQEGPAIHVHRTAKTDSEGFFEFKDIKFDPKNVYGVSVTYGGALYGFDVDLLSSPDPLVITVFEPTHDNSALSVEIASVLFAQVDKLTQTIWALEIVSIGNHTDTTYVPGPEPMQLMRFGLPQGAQGLVVDSRLIEASVIQVEQGFGLVSSVPPGEHEVMYSYHFQYSGTSTEFLRSFRYGAEHLRILVPAEVGHLATDKLDPAEPVVIGNKIYEVATASNMPRGTIISIRLTNLPSPSFLDVTKKTLKDFRWDFVFPLTVAVSLTILVFLSVWKRGFANRASINVNQRGFGEQPEYHQLLIDLAGLEQKLENSDIDQTTYDRARSVIASKLYMLSENPQA